MGRIEFILTQMKVKEIYIKDFRQFKDLTLDLTYPTGHAKAGKALDKVCFIGQSGTGKTNLLKLLFLVRMPGEAKNKLETLAPELINKVAFKVVDSRNKELIVAFKKGSDYSMDSIMSAFFLTKNIYTDILNDLFFGNPLIDSEEIRAFLSHDTKENEQLIYFPTGLKYDFKQTNSDKNIQSKKVFDFSKESVYGLWNSIVEDVTKYQEEELKIRQKISFLAEQGDLDGTQKEVNNLKNWKESNNSPIKDIAEKCINPLVEKFHVRVREGFSIEKKEDIGFIKLESFEGKEIPYNSWSTGTKQVVLSALPLYLIKPEYSTVLFDEPEASLYPDLQRIIIDYYQSITKNCQFFYATHSPIIASSFEPWEIVELKFNKDGTVYRELYYEGENHIDNYKWNPQYMRWDDILNRIFDMKDDGSPKRKEKLDKLARCNVKYRKLEKNGQKDSTEAKELITLIEKLSKELSHWD